MSRIPFTRKNLDPRCTMSFLDSCAFNPQQSEHDAAQEIRNLGKDGQVNLTITHCTQKELEHPNTPMDVKREATEIQYTIATSLTPKEKESRRRVHEILTGNGKPATCAADAAHVSEAEKYGGYFITTDQRILDKREGLQRESGAVILAPTEWLSIFNGAAAA